MERKRESRVNFRVDDATYAVMEQLRGLGVNTSDLMRELMTDLRPGLEGMVRVLEATRDGRKLDAKKEQKRMLGELVKQMTEE